jgi:predicted tellurium resistance membrane protein TerC
MNPAALLADPNAWAALLSLSVLEIVLGIDNLVFISLLTSGLEEQKARHARRIGLALAFLFRVVMLATLTWLVRLTQPLFFLFSIAISWRDIILIGGGLFLIGKATYEIHREVEGVEDDKVTSVRSAPAAIAQIVIIDLVFSIDSIITAIGTTEHLEIMVTAVVIAMLIMYAAAGPVGNFIAEHPTTKMLALAFLVLIGVALIADGFDLHIPRGYIYFAMAFAAAVEAINVLVSRRRKRRRRIQ